MPALDQWEKRLKPYFSRKLYMIGEIPISRLELEDMISGVSSCIKRNGLSRATEILYNEHPSTFIVFLTAFGAYNTANDYWGALGEEIGVKRENLFNKEWHHKYYEKIKKLGLRHFVGEDPARPYVTTIRFHGGIPVYSLPDYFRHFVIPSIERSELSEVSARQAIDVLMRTAYNVDSPVINFLENSGELGESFFESCRKLARHYQKYNEILVASEIDLPERIVRAFEAYVQDELIPEDGGAKFRLRKPTLLFAPSYEQAHLYVRLPEQEIPLRFASGCLEWCINIHGETEATIHTCNTWMQRQSMTIEEEYVPLDASPRAVQVSLMFVSNENSQTILGRWLLPLMTSGTKDQLIAFRSDGVALRPGEPLPAEELLLVYPTDLELVVDGSSNPSHYYGDLYEAWRGWQANGWDLSSAWSAQLFRGQQAAGNPIPIAGKLPLPELSGSIFHHNVDPNGIPLFIDNVPTLRVPIRPSFQLARELSRWRLAIRSSENTYPAMNKSCSLIQIQDHVSVDNEWASIPLKHLLGDNPIGEFSVCTSGPLDDETEFRFRIWPQATVMGLKKNLLSSSGNSEPQTFNVRLPNSASCELQPGATGVKATNRIYYWEISVDPDVTSADLDWTWVSENNESVRVPVFIPIPRLRWALVLDQNQGHMLWTTHLIQRPLDQVIQSDAGSIHVTMPGLDSAAYLALEVTDIDSGKVRQSERFQKTPFAPDWQRLALGKFRDTLRHAGSLTQLDLVYRSSYKEEEIRVPLLLLSRQLEVFNVKLTSLGELKWSLDWEQPNQLKNRRVLMKPAWQPWQDTWEFVIPDHAAGNLVITDIGLVSARYHLYFYVAPVGEPAIKVIPADSHYSTIDLCSPNERLDFLDAQLTDFISRNAYESAFRAALESACIYEDLDQLDKRDAKLSELSKLYKHVSSLQLLLGLFHWFDDLQIDNPYSKFFRRYMFRPELVKEILSRYNKNDNELNMYLEYVPSIQDIYSESARLIAQYTNNPAILNACLNRLVQQEDTELGSLILQMVSSSKLLSTDAADILSEKPTWSLLEVAAEPSSSVSDQLIADILVRVSERITELPSSDRQGILYRALPYISESSLQNELVKDLLKQGDREVFHCLMRAYKIRNTGMDEIVNLLSPSPQFSITVLRSISNNEIHQKLLDALVTKYPTAAGIIVPGCMIKTPAGKAVVISIETTNGQQRTTASLRDPEILVHLTLGKDAGDEKITLNCSKQILSFDRATTVFTCGHCGFINPDRRVIDQHHKVAHRYQSLKLGSTAAQLIVDFDQLDIFEH